MLMLLFRVAALLLLAPTLALADGRIEINQAIVDEAGGFPYTIAAPGNYVLTSNLTVATDLTAISIAPSLNVSIDLNGFRIQGPQVCAPGNCVPGTASGVVGGGSNLVVKGGQVNSFSGSCVVVGSGSRVDSLRIYSCGVHGISAGITSSVMHNIVSGTGTDGIRLADVSSVYAHNTVTNTDLNGTGGVGIRNGVATAGNFCDDSSCASLLKRYYLTETFYQGNHGAAVCDPGYHMASAHELLTDAAGLAYDPSRTLGFDNVSGPPTSLPGWVRSGFPGTGLGRLSCEAEANVEPWTDATPSSNGPILVFVIPSGADIAGWKTSYDSCNRSYPVWCIQD